MRFTSVLTTFTVPALALAAGDAPDIDPNSEFGRGLQLGQTSLFERDQIPHVNVFNRRQSGCNAHPRACINNFCARAVKEGGDEAPALTSRQEDCSSFMHKTVSEDYTTTVTAGVADVYRRQQSSAPTDVPSYVTAACTDAEKYSSACSCWGITASTTTVSSVSTTTVEPVPPPTLTGVIEVTRNDNGAVLGYITLGGNVYISTWTSSTDQATKFKVQGSASGDTVSQVNLELVDTTRGNYYGLVMGRDSTNSDIGAGSFHYIYPGPVSDSTAPGSTPQQIGSYYKTISGLNKAAESSVWNINFSTGAVTAQWVNTDGSTPNTVFWTQSNYIYAGGDSAAFHARYSSPVYELSFKWVTLS